MSTTNSAKPSPGDLLKSKLPLKKSIKGPKPLSEKTQFNKQELEACSDGELFAGSDARLPADQLLMLDRIVDIKPHGGVFNKGEIVAEIDITEDNWFFECHFKGEPLMPGSLMLEGMWQTLGFYLGWSGYPGKARALGLGELKLRGEVKPDAGALQYRISIRKIAARQTVLAIANGVILQDGAEIASAKDLRVGLFSI